MVPKEKEREGYAFSSFKSAITPYTGMLPDGPSSCFMRGLGWLEFHCQYYVSTTQFSLSNRNELENIVILQVMRSLFSVQQWSRCVDFSPHVQHVNKSLPWSLPIRSSFDSSAGEQGRRFNHLAERCDQWQPGRNTRPSLQPSSSIDRGKMTFGCRVRDFLACEKLTDVNRCKRNISHVCITLSYKRTISRNALKTKAVAYSSGDGDGFHLPRQAQRQACTTGAHLLHSWPGPQVLPHYRRGWFRVTL